MPHGKKFCRQLYTRWEYTTEQNWYCLKRFYNASIVIRVQYKFHGNVTTEKFLEDQIGEKFWTDWFCDTHKKGIVGRKKSMRMFENTECAGSAYTKPEQTCQMAISTDGFKTNIHFNHCSTILTMCPKKFRCNNPWPTLTKIEKFP
jgi:hypothetical protein